MPHPNHTDHAHTYIAPPPQLAELKPDKFDPKVVTASGDYVYAEYTSPTFGFVDDVEFW